MCFTLTGPWVLLSYTAGKNVSTELGSPRDLVTSDVTESSFGVSWTAAPGNVRQYRITWKSMFSDEAGEKTIRGDTTDTVLDGLTPETLYHVSVYAIYGHGEGQPLTGEETTDSKSLKIFSICFFFSSMHDMKCSLSVNQSISIRFFWLQTAHFMIVKYLWGVSWGNRNLCCSAKSFQIMNCPFAQLVM